MAQLKMIGITIVTILSLGLAASLYADCKMNVWSNYHQYQTKGPKTNLSFKLVKINQSTVWLHCATGKPDKNLLLKYSDNAKCLIVKNPRDKNSLGAKCVYKAKNDKPCIKLKLQCI